MRFIKMQGVGNDFVVVDAAQAVAWVSDKLEVCDERGCCPTDTMPQFAALAVHTCDRRFGIGADGLLVLSHEDDGKVRFRMRMFNPDGTEDMCGNGLRCAGLWALREGWINGVSSSIVVTKEGLRPVELTWVSDDQSEAILAVGMGEPHFDLPSIPFVSLEPLEEVVNVPIQVDDRVFVITALNTSSTHTVIFGPPPSEDDFQRYSPQIETHPSFPERTSVLWVTPGSGTLKMRIWERGVGETLGCGSGACAAVVAAQRLGIVPEGARVEVESRGGVLAITWPGPGLPIRMEGPAILVYEGDLRL